MTDALPIAWIALVLGGVALGYIAARDWLDGRRLDEQSEALDLAMQALDAAVLRISYLEDAARGIEEREAPQNVFPQVDLEEPTTQPIPRAVRTDTADQSAVIGEGLAAITAEVAHYGRHAHRN